MRGVSCKNAFLGAVCVHIVVSFEAVFWHVTQRFPHKNVAWHPKKTAVRETMSIEAF